MAQKWYLEIYKIAEKVGRTKEIRILNYAGEILFALGLVLSSLLSYWLVWTLNGLGKFPEPPSDFKTRKRAYWAAILKQHQAGLTQLPPRSVLTPSLQPPAAEGLGVYGIGFTDALARR
jgi:hypothetical protein